MTNSARYDADGVVIETFEHETLTPADVFPPALAQQFEACPDGVRGGWSKVGQAFVPPTLHVPSGSPSAEAFVVDIPTFKMRFSPDQLLAIRACADVRVKAFLTEIIDDQRTQNVNLALPYVQGAMLLLHGLGLIGAEDVTRVLAPVE